MANSTEEFFAKQPVLHGTVMIVLVTTGKVKGHHYDIPKTQKSSPLATGKACAIQLME
jgi:hypothetical protein